MTRRKTLVVGLTILGILLSYCLFCARSFVLRPKLNIAVGTPEEAIPVIEGWFEVDKTFRSEEFSFARYFYYLSNPYCQPPPVRVGPPIIEPVIALHYECAPNISVVFHKTDGYWKLLSVQHARSKSRHTPPPLIPSPVSKPEGWEEYKKLYPLPGVKSGKLDSIQFKNWEKHNKAVEDDPYQRFC